MNKLVFVLAVAVSAVACAEGYESTYRVAVIANNTTYKGHAREFDGVREMLPDWTIDKYNVDEQMAETGELDDFYSKISSYDFVITCPLVPDIFSSHVDEIRAFCEQGGILVVTDCNYPRLYTWTDGLGEGYNHSHGEGMGGWNPVVLKELDPVPTLRNFPRRQVDGCMLWYHLNIDENGTKWRNYLNCGYHGKPVLLGAPIGKGEVIESCLRVPYVQFFENVRAKQALGKAGFEIVRGTGGEMTDAKGTVELSLKVKDGGTVPPKGWRLELKISKDGEEKPYVVKAKPEGPKATEPVNALAFKLDYVNPVRGAGIAKLTLKGPDGDIVVFERRQTFAELLTLRKPEYRGLISEAHRGTKFLGAATINPGEEDLKSAKLSARLVGPDGKAGKFVPCGEFDGTNRVDFALDLPLGTPAGDYRLEAEVKNAKGQSYAASIVVPVVATNAAQIVGDQDHVLLRAGKPWFPMGVYGMGNEDFDTALPEMGFDFLQQMNWLNSDFELATKHNASILWENKHKGDANFIIHAKKFRDTVGFGMHYITDEPMDELYYYFNRWSNLVRENDPNHPAFCVLLYQSSYAYQYDSFDVIGLDEYPINKEGAGDVTRVATRLDEYRRRAGDHKPIIMVLQSFGQETEELHRQMAYLAVIHGANGILWFAWRWDDGGMSTSSQSRAGAAQVTKELKAIEAALTSTTRPVAEVTNGGKTHTAVVGDKSTGRYRITVDLTKEDEVCSIKKLSAEEKSKDKSKLKAKSKDKAKLKAKSKGKAKSKD